MEASYEQQTLRRDLNSTRADIGLAQKGISELEGALERASDSMKPQFEDVISKKHSHLKELVTKADNLKNKLVISERPEPEEEKFNPYHNVRRSSLSDTVKAAIVKDHGVESYLKMPL